MNRRRFLWQAAINMGGLALGVAGGRAATATPGRRASGKELRIRRILVHDVPGRRLTPVAPNAGIAYRGTAVREHIVQIQTDQGIEGIGRASAPAETLKKLVGMDPFALFEWEGDAIKGAAAAHRDITGKLYSADGALLDILGQALKRPVAALLGKEVRKKVPVYDSSLYMEDLLKPKQREGLVYLKGAPPSDPAELVARKALWILEQPEGIRILKIKIGRVKWMNSIEEALERDIAVIRAIRNAVGKEVTLFVDGNNGYDSRPLAAADFALAVKDQNVYAMEEMFREEKVAEHRKVKQRMRGDGVATKLADGEGHRGGIPETLLKERVGKGRRSEPLFDINQPDWNVNGYLRMQSVVRTSARHGLTVAPHNFASKMGFYLQVHLGMVASNWEFSETDDSEFPALSAPGMRIEKGHAVVTGAPGLGLSLRKEKLGKPKAVFDG